MVLPGSEERIKYPLFEILRTSVRPDTDPSTNISVRKWIVGYVRQYTLYNCSLRERFPEHAVSCRSKPLDKTSKRTLSQIVKIHHNLMTCLLRASAFVQREQVIYNTFIDLGLGKINLREDHRLCTFVSTYKYIDRQIPILLCSLKCFKPMLSVDNRSHTPKRYDDIWVFIVHVRLNDEFFMTVRFLKSHATLVN